MKNFKYLQKMQEDHKAMWDEMRAKTLSVKEAQAFNNHFGKQLKYITTMLAAKQAEKDGIKIDFVADEDEAT
jgi:hypothetical protein